jgi:hypothetical protein
MEIDGVFTIGIWSDLDSPTLRDAIRVFHPEGMPPVRYLDGAGIPPRFKLRSVPGDPVPPAVLREMEQNPAAPWEVRDRLLSGLRWVPYAEWKAQQLNQLFRLHGRTGQPGRIKPETVQDGLEKQALRSSLRRNPNQTTRNVSEESRGILPSAENSRPIPAEPRRPHFDNIPITVTRRTEGQTATFGPYEWIYNPLGITAATWRQIEELCTKGEGPIQVIQWPGREVIFDSRKWKTGHERKLE